METLHKKVLLVVTKSNWGGAQAYVHTLATHLKEQSFDVAVALGGTGTPDAPAGRLASELASAGVRTLFLPSFTRDLSAFRDLRAFFELYRVVKSERPGVLHLNSSKAGGLGAFAGRLAGVPRIVFTSHGLAYDEARGSLARLLIAITTWLTFLFCHRVIVISKDTRRRASGLPFCKHKVRLVYNGLAPQNLIDRDDARAALLPNTATSPVWIGTIAELTPNKNLATLLEAAALVKKSAVPFTLCIIGQGEQQEALEQKIAALQLEDSVHLLGFVPDAARYLQAFDIFTLTSTKEGLPYVLLEAAEARCAVVGSSIAGITDIVDSKTGILVPPTDPSRIAEALSSLLSSPEQRATLGNALQNKVRQQFSLEKMFSGILATYKD